MLSIHQRLLQAKVILHITRYNEVPSAWLYVCETRIFTKYLSVGIVEACMNTLGVLGAVAIIPHSYI